MIDVFLLWVKEVAPFPHRVADSPPTYSEVIMKHRKIYDILPYTYFIQQKSTKLSYYGVRVANVGKGMCPADDLGVRYFTSGKLADDFKKNPDDFYVRVCFTFDSPREAYEYEYSVLQRVYHRSNFANISSGNSACVIDEDVKLNMREAGLRYLPEHGMTLDKLRGKLSAESRRERGIFQQAAKKASVTMKTKILPCGKTLDEVRVERSAATKSKPDENGESIYSIMGKNLSQKLKTVEENGYTVAQNRHRRFIASLLQLSDKDFYDWINSRAERYQKYIKNQILKLHGISK